MILQSFRWNILCCHVKIPQSHKNMYRLISTLIRYFRILCTNYTHSNRVEMLLLQKSFTTAAYWQRTHGTAAPRGCEARGWARGNWKSEDRREMRYPGRAPAQTGDTLLASPGSSCSLLQPPALATPHHLILSDFTDSFHFYCSKFLHVKCEAIHYIKFRNILRTKYVRVRAIIKIQNVVQDGTLKMQRICPVSGFSWEKSVYWATWRV